MSSPDPAAVTDAMNGADTSDSKTRALSPPSAAVMAQVAAGTAPDWSDNDAVLANRVDTFGVLAGSAYPYDVASRRELFRQEIERANDMAGSQNHALVVGTSERWMARLGEISVPTLVIHGDEDPILPLDHGQAIADSISGAELLVMPGVGHEFPGQELGKVIPAILKVTESA